MVIKKEMRRLTDRRRTVHGTATAKENKPGSNPAILFVNPVIKTSRSEKEDLFRSYLGLGTLASAIKDNAFLKRFCERLGKKELIFKDEHLYPSLKIRVLNIFYTVHNPSICEHVAEFIKTCRHTPIMVCMTATSAQLDEAEAVAGVAEKTAPKAVRIIGGPHVSVVADYLNHSAFQVACMGEGVETLAETAVQIHAAKKPDFASIQGIAYKDRNGQVHINSSRKPVMTLDEYPFPSESLSLFAKQKTEKERKNPPLVYILAGYGCPHDCIFCAQRAIHNGRIRERSAENIIQEIERLYKQGFRKFALVQETFLIRKKRVMEFCRLIKGSGMKIEWTAESRADQIQYRQLKRMREAGLRFIQIGVESGDPELLKTIDKKIHLDQVILLRSWCVRLKIDTAFYFLVGLPGQGWQSILKSALFVMDYPPFNRITKHVSVSITIPYPGTKIERDRTVRLSAGTEKLKNWPDRNPEVSVNDQGVFTGQNYTETDDMTPEEILEAWIYLDDFCHFLLHALYAGRLNSTEKTTSINYADRMLYMIMRRTIRDIIVRAQPGFDAITRKNARAEIIEIDADAEKSFRTVTARKAPISGLFLRFLASATFLNGFNTMKRFTIDNRIKWMKICGVIWHANGRQADAFQFENDHEHVGKKMNDRLETIDALQINRILIRIDSRLPVKLFPDMGEPEETISLFGFFFNAREHHIVIIGEPH